MIHDSRESLINSHCLVNMKLISAIIVANTLNAGITDIANVGLQGYIKRSEIKYCCYLHDVHGLINVIWWRPEPKLAVKRKQGADAQQKRAGVSSDSEGSMGDIPTVTLLLSSARMTPGLDLIDPRLLKLGVLGDNGITLVNKVPKTPGERPSPLNHDEGTGHDKTVVQSCEYMSSLCISGNACDCEDARVAEPTTSPSRAKLNADISWVDGGSLEDGVPRGDALTRGRMMPRYSLKSLNTGYILKADYLLVPGERSVLCWLKSQNLTWRSITPSHTIRNPP
ncbi:hypothetical protein BJX70DRAFT_393091 [Aspergillus crustosus]